MSTSQKAVFVADAARRMGTEVAKVFRKPLERTSIKPSNDATILTTAVERSSTPSRNSPSPEWNSIAASTLDFRLVV